MQQSAQQTESLQHASSNDVLSLGVNAPSTIESPEERSVNNVSDASVKAADAVGVSNQAEKDFESQKLQEAVNKAAAELADKIVAGKMKAFLATHTLPTAGETDARGTPTGQDENNVVQTPKKQENKGKARQLYELHNSDSDDMSPLKKKKKGDAPLEIDNIENPSSQAWTSLSLNMNATSDTNLENTIPRPVGLSNTMVAKGIQARMGLSEDKAQYTTICNKVRLILLSTGYNKKIGFAEGDNAKAIRAIRAKVWKQIPFLHRFQDSWATDALVRMIRDNQGQTPRPYVPRTIKKNANLMVDGKNARASGSALPASQSRPKLDNGSVTDTDDGDDQGTVGSQVDQGSKDGNY